MSTDVTAPDLLVLGSGGVLGDVWMTGIVAGLIRTGKVDPRRSGRFTGTSAGSIVATRLAAGEDLDALVDRYSGTAGSPAESGLPAGTVPPGELEPRHRHRPLARLLAGHGAAGRFVRRRAMGLVSPGKKELRYLKRDMATLAPDWPERLNIAAFNATTGHRVVFSRGQSHGLSVSEAVQASCAIPGVFQPIKGPDGLYVDGGVWSPVNLDAVEVDPGRTVVCLTPSGSYQGARGIRRRAAGSYFRAVAEGEVSRLRSRGVRVINVVPDAAASVAIGPNRMASGRELLVYEAGLAQGIVLAGPLADRLRPEYRAPGRSNLKADKQI